MKHLFPAFTANPGLVYLDSAATALRPQQVVDAVARFSGGEYANIHRGLYPLAVRATEAYEGARATIAGFIGAQPEEVIFTKNATEGINLLAAALPKSWQAGDAVILSELEHHANIVPWQQAASRFNLELKFAKVTEDGEIDVDHLRSLVSANVRLVSLSHCSNVFGTFTPFPEVKKIVAEQGSGTLLLADASQSAPHASLSVHDLGVDFLVFSGHKAYGPSGTGVLWGRRDLLGPLPPYQTGGDMIRTVALEGATWNDIPYRFEAGTPNIEGAVGLAEAVRFLQSIGMDKVAEHTSSLTAYALTHLKNLPGLKILGNPDLKSGIISFTVDGIHPHDLADLLGQRDICIRAGHHCAMPLHAKLDLVASNRASFGVYNDASDIDELTSAVAQIMAEVGSA